MSERDEKIVQEIQDALSDDQSKTKYSVSLDKEDPAKLFDKIFGNVTKTDAPVLGYLVWLRGIDAESPMRYLKIDSHKSYPESVGWVDQPGETSIFPNPELAKQLADNLLDLPVRKMMGKIMPALPIAIGLNWKDSEVQINECEIGVSVVIVGTILGRRRFMLEIKEDTSLE